MPKGIYNVPKVVNEPILNYAPGSSEKADVKKALQVLKGTEIDAPMYIGGKEVRTNELVRMAPPHDHKHTLGHFHRGTEEHVQMAIDAALNAKEKWANLSWEHRASIFLKAADLLAGPYRAKMNAATMLAQSKNVFQAEIDAVCEYADFLRFNVEFMTEIYEQQPPYSPAATWNRLEQRPLEGFVFALTPFNFTSIAGNLPAAPALMGNTVVWKPADTQVYSAQILMEIFIEAGLPEGVINLVYVRGPVAGTVIFKHKDFAGIHFTGSTGVFQNIWKTIGENIHNYKSYPRIVGETGGKDFIVAHPSSDAKEVATAMVRGAFEFQGQKCSAASRCYIPSNIWNDVRDFCLTDLETITMGDPENFSHFVNAVIDEKSFDKIANYIDNAKADGEKIVAGGNYDKSKGYFVEPTIIVTDDPKYTTMCEEIFGPVLTVYVYDENKWEETLDLVDQTSPYALTGAIFSKDRYAIESGMKKLENCAGNFYINDKPTGAVVGQQPFGGARGSGTNDKAGSMINLLRWVSPRTIKENFVSPTDYRYPFLGES
jgi:1-pyrroline-5-carboxylate dehydrogenase